MDTPEHREAGNQITLDKSIVEPNPFLENGTFIDGHINPLNIQLMRIGEHGIPMPTGLTLKAGDIVALQGDYFTSPGWGKKLEVQSQTTPPQKQTYKNIATKDVTRAEKGLFRNAYGALASPHVTKALIDEIYADGKKHPTPSSTLNEYLEQIQYMEDVPHYLKSLKENEAHFAPWSTRAYIVGHNVALEYAEVAHLFKQLSNSSITTENLDPTHNSAHLKVSEMCKRLQENSSDFNFSGAESEDRYLALAHRFEALAIGMELSVMHYYSDHFAGGHLSRLGFMRQTLSEQFGFFGQTLVNSMHDEDNHYGVTVCYGDGSTEAQTLSHKPEIARALGDGRYDSAQNDTNANQLINGMTTSLADIVEVAKGTKARGDISVKAYGGRAFLPQVDFSKPQLMPMFITKGKQIYYRYPIDSPSRIEPEAYQLIQQSPEKVRCYKKLTKWRAIKLFVRLRIAPLIPIVNCFYGAIRYPEATSSLKGFSQQVYQKEGITAVSRGGSTVMGTGLGGPVDTTKEQHKSSEKPVQQGDVTVDGSVSAATQPHGTMPLVNPLSM